MKETQGLIEQHIHGAFGIDFMKCSKDELLNCAQLLAQNGVGAFFPTVMTDELEIIKERISLIKSSQKSQDKKSAQIAGIHLEGPFINPEKSGIHDKKYILPLDINKYKFMEDDIIKIITLAPELDISGEFVKYLKTRNIKLSLGHSLGHNLSDMNQVTHLYNAMGAFSHRNPSTCVSALCCDNIYVEIIADSLHVCDDVLKITFKQKSPEKILLISDALPLAHSNKESLIFAGQQIYNKNCKLTNKDGIIAGSSMLLCDIIKNITDKSILTFEQAINASSHNQLKYHKLNNNLKVYWNEDNTINKVEFI